MLNYQTFPISNYDLVIPIVCSGLIEIINIDCHMMGISCIYDPSIRCKKAMTIRCMCLLLFNIIICNHCSQ